MGIGGFFGRLFKGADSSSVPSPGIAQAPAPAPVPTPSPELRPVSAVPPRAILHREEMLDGRGRLCGYRFSFKRLDPAVPPPPGAYSQALRGANVQALAQRRMAVIVVELDDWPREDFSSLIGPRTVFQVNLPPNARLSAEWLTGLQQLHEAGVSLALSRAESDAQWAPALSMAGLGFIDFSAYSMERFERLMRELRTGFPQLALAVENIPSWAERRLSMALGAEYALGDFLASADEEDKGGKLNQSRLVLIEMLNQLRNDADPDAIAHVAKRDPGIVVQILAMANSPLSGLRTPVAGIDQAIHVLGRETLYRWLLVSMFRIGSVSGHDEALLEVALARGRFLELMALSALSKAEADELFLVGLLSFVDVLLGLPMASILAKMSLSPPVQDVLLHSQGVYGRYLKLAILVEKGHADKAAELATALGLPTEVLDAYRSIAMLWVQEALGQAG